MKEVLIPEGNKKDIQDLPDIVKRRIAYYSCKNDGTSIRKGITMKKKPAVKRHPKPVYTRKEITGPRIMQQNI